MGDVDPFSLSALLDDLEEPIGDENPEFPPPVANNLPPPVANNLTEETQSLINSFGSVVLTPQQRQAQRLSLFMLMTSNSEGGENSSQFTGMIPRLGELELMNMVSLFASHPKFFLNIARNKNGSKRIVKLLGESDNLDTVFLDTITSCFLSIMTDKRAYVLVIRAIQVFEGEKKETLYKEVLKQAKDLARTKYGCYALNSIMNHDQDDRVPETIGINALRLSNHAYGNYVVQNVLKKNELLYTSTVANELKGHFVELSFQKHGSYVVEKILETKQPEIIEIVADEFLQCERDDLRKLAKDKYGLLVLQKILDLTTDVDKFKQLCRKIIAATCSI